MHTRFLPTAAGTLAATVAIALATGFLSISVRAQQRQIGGVGLTVFADPGFRGESATFREDVSNLQSVGLNDCISSLRVARGEVWEVCENANYLGRCQVVSGEESDLRGIGWSDIISSARRIRDDGDGRGRGRGRGRGGNSRGSLELFSDVRYSGERRSFSDEASNLQVVNFNDRARSLRVTGSGSWQVCVDANFQNCVVVSRDTPDLARMGMTRRISSLRPWGKPALNMSRLRFKISMSLDGFVAGLNQSVDNPLGIGGGRLHEWAFQLAAFRALLGFEGGEVNESTRVVEESFANIGATVMGRNMFGGHPGPWNAVSPWTGWWGANPPFHHPVFVLTHYRREPLELQGGTTFTFVTKGIEQALDLARHAAGGKDVSLGGGATAAQQYLAAGLVDEMDINLVPTLLGNGERLFTGVGDNLHGLSLVRTIATLKVVHLKFAKG